MGVNLELKNFEINKPSHIMSKDNIETYNFLYENWKNKRELALKNRGKFIRRYAKLSCPINFNEILKNSEKLTLKTITGEEIHHIFRFLFRSIKTRLKI